MNVERLGVVQKVMDPEKGTSRPQFWLLITTRNAWSRLKRNGAWAFSDGSRPFVSRIKAGDLGVAYLTVDKHAGSSAIGGIIEFTGSLVEIRGDDIFDRIYPLRIPFREILAVSQPIPFPPLVESLEFIRNKRNWGSHLQGQSAKPLALGDFQTLEIAVKSAEGLAD